MVCYENYNNYSDNVTCCAGSGPEYGISLDDMCEIRVGHGTDTFNGVTKNTRKDGLANVDVGSGKKLNITRQHCFSIIFKGNTRPLDLVSDDVATAKLWVSTILYYNRISNTEIITFELWYE